MAGRAIAVTAARRALPRTALPRRALPRRRSARGIPVSVIREIHDRRRIGFRPESHEEPAGLIDPVVRLHLQRTRIPLLAVGTRQMHHHTASIPLGVGLPPPQTPIEPPVPSVQMVGTVVPRQFVPPSVQSETPPGDTVREAPACRPDIRPGLQVGPGIRQPQTYRCPPALPVRLNHRNDTRPPVADLEAQSM